MPSYVEGHEHLLSNEFDWYKSGLPSNKSEVVLGPGTNSLWDLALHNKADYIIFADWSPWPLLTQEYIFAPLPKNSRTAQEFTLSVSGIPPKYARGLMLEESFERAKEFTLSKINDQKKVAWELIQFLSRSEMIDELDLKFLTTYFRSRLGDNLNPRNGYGPFAKLSSPNSANFPCFLYQRYNPAVNGRTSSALSSQENFEFLKSLFLDKKISYALTDIMDKNFYKEVVRQFSRINNFSISLSNIFECGHYNNLVAEDVKALKMNLKSFFQGKNLHTYQTLHRAQPYKYLLEKLV